MDLNNSCNQCGNDIKPKLNQNYHINVNSRKSVSCEFIPAARGPAAKARSNARAAAHQASLASAEVNAPPASSPPRPPRPLHHLLSPSPSTGRRRVMSLAPFSYLTLYCLIVNESSGPKRVTHHIFYSVHIHISKHRVILTIPHRISNPKSLISLQPTKAFMRLS